MKIESKRAKNGGVALSVTCDKCGKPITVANDYGMFCEDKCGEEAKKEYDMLKSMIKMFIPDEES